LVFLYEIHSFLLFSGNPCKNKRFVWEERIVKVDCPFKSASLTPARRHYHNNNLWHAALKHLPLLSRAIAEHLTTFQLVTNTIYTSPTRVLLSSRHVRAWINYIPAANTLKRMVAPAWSESSPLREKVLRTTRNICCIRRAGKVIRGTDTGWGPRSEKWFRCFLARYTLEWRFANSLSGCGIRGAWKRLGSWSYAATKYTGEFWDNIKIKEKNTSFLNYIGRKWGRGYIPDSNKWKKKKKKNSSLSDVISNE
jgi:hypothetical protein